MTVHSAATTVVAQKTAPFVGAFDVQKVWRKGRRKSSRQPRHQQSDRCGSGCGRRHSPVHCRHLSFVLDPSEEQRRSLSRSGRDHPRRRSARRRRQIRSARAEPWDQYQDFGHSHWHNSLIWGENLENISILGPVESGERDWCGAAASRARKSRTTHSRNRGPIRKPARSVIQMRATQSNPAGETKRSV